MRSALLAATLLVGPLGACSDDAASVPPPPVPSAGHAGAPRGGNAGTGGRSIAGAGGAGAGAPGGTSAAGAGGVAGAGGQSGAAAAGASSGTSGASAGGSLAAGNAGQGGAAGTMTYASDLHPGPNVIPTDCPLAHGRWGCCGPDGNAYFIDPFSAKRELQMEQCDPLHQCGWAPFQLRFACGGEGDAHPYGIPSTCGAPAYAEGCISSCKVDADCPPEVWGQGSLCYFSHPEATGQCVRCVTDAECPTGTFCDPEGQHYCRKKACTTDAECAAKDPSLPACSPWDAVCIACKTDAQCAGPGMGCFAGSCACKTDEACASSALGHRCDPIERDCGCKTAADCPTATPLCISQRCSSCYDDEDCSNGVGKPYCVIDGATRRCVACRKDTDCPDGKPVCNGGSCEQGCSSWFDCGGSKPVCDGASCVSAPSCAGDDAAEPADDSPLTTASTLLFGASLQAKVCGLAGERDHFRIVLPSRGDIVLDLASSDPRVFMALSDDQGRLLGLSIHSVPQHLQARALPAGTYYAAVGMAAEVDPATSAYTLTLQGGGTACGADADCANVTATEIYRGHCEVSSGACMFIDGKGSLGAAAPCDDDKDCTSGFCSGYAFAANPAARSRCSAPCDGPTGLGQAPLNELCASAQLDATWVCTTFEQVNRCLPRCQTDAECPLVDPLAQPAPGQPWLHMTCGKDGHCEYYE